MTDIDIVAELRNCDYMAACGELNALGSDRSHLREVEKIAYLAEIAMPALLDVVEALRWYADERNYNDFCPGHSVDCGYDGWDWEFVEDNGERARAALAVLERSDEG